MNIIRLEIRSLRKNALISSLVIGASVFAMLLFFPSMATDSMQQLANTKLEGIDPALLEAFGLATMPDFTVITNYFGYVMQYITLALMVIVMTQATALFIKEETDGTIEFLYAKPVTRTDIFVQKTASLLIYLISIILFLFAISTIGYVLYSDFSLMESIKEVAIFYGATLFAGLIFASIGILLSTHVKSSKSVIGLSIGVVFGSFIIGIMSIIVKDLDVFIWLSPLDWIKADKLMNEGILLGEYGVGILVIVVSLMLAWKKYSKKDFLV